MTDSSAAPAPVPAIWGNVPQRNKNFTGRVDFLSQLRRGATSQVTAVLPGEPLQQALQGLGGVGKTAVAIEYAYRCRSDYDLVWWIPADQLPLVRASLAALAGPLGLAAAAATGIEGAATAVLDALRRGEPFRRWLLIFDNADQPEELNNYIPRGPGDVLLTSRNHRWDPVINTVQLDVFTREESKEFLFKRVSKGLTEADADRLAEQLGDLPLALEQAGAMIAETAIPVDEYLRLLKEQVTQIMAEGKPAEYPLSMTGAWRLSVQALQDQMPQAIELLRCCAFFGPDPIPRDVFRRSTQATGTRVSELIADPILLARAIRELGRFALVKLDGRTLSVHRLIQALLRDDLDQDAQTGYQHEVHTILAAGAPNEPTDSQQWLRYGELLPHVASAATELPRSQSEEVRSFVRDILRYLYYSGDFASCLSLADRFITHWTKDSGPDSPDVLDAQRISGNALRELGRYNDAYQIVQATLEKARQALGNRNSLTLALQNAFASDLRARGDFAKAFALDRECLDLYEELFGGSDPRTLRAMNNLGLDHGLRSEYGKAAELHRVSYLRQSAASSGVSITEVLSSWNSLARDVRLSGTYTEARDVGEDALDYGREKLGAEHLWTLRTMKDLSIALRRVAVDYDEALEMATQVHNLCTRLFGESNPDTMAAAIALTNIQRTMGDTKRAFELAQATVARYPDVYGPTHPFNYGCAGNLALLQRVMGDAAEALKLNQACLDGLDSRLTRMHHFSLTVAVNMASDLAVLGETIRARTLGEQTFAQLCDLLGENHPMTLGCAANLALDRMADNAVADAESLRADTISRYIDTLGPDHPDTRVATAGNRIDFDFDPQPI